MKRESEIAEKLREFLKENVLEVKIPRDRRIFVRVKNTALKDAVKHLVNDLGFKHLSTITGIDVVEEIEVIYHLAHKGSIELSLRVTVPKEKPIVPTVTDVIPGAVLYEREVHDLLGVEFKGHPDLSPLVLPEEWPNDIYPLRKEHSLEGLKELTSEK